MPAKVSALKVDDLPTTPTGSVKVERSLPERTGGCEFKSQPGHTKDLKNGNRYTLLSAKLGSDNDNPRRWLSSGQDVVWTTPVSKWGN